MKFAASTAKVFAIMAEGGVLEGLRLYPGPWSYRAVSKDGGTLIKPGEPTVASWAMNGLVRGTFTDRGQNTHVMSFVLTEAGRNALAHYELNKKTTATRGAG